VTATLTALKPEIVADRIKFGRAILVDIREPDEFVRRHVKGALSRPLSTFEAAQLKIEAGKEVVFTCKSGMRTGSNCARLAKAVEGPAFILEGGVDGWATAGFPVEEAKDAPIEIMRQVQIAAGSLVLAGVALGFLVHPAFFAVSGLIGAGLTFAGASGFCGMAKLLALMPWNRSAQA
jgi:rhodanese-related sulfurtransferase